MKICLTTTLGCSVSEAWNALNDPEVFQQVSRPFLSFRPVRPGVFPAAWVSGESYLVEALALGFLPMGTQEINPRTSEEAMAKTFRDEGRGIQRRGHVTPMVGAPLHPGVARASPRAGAR